MHIGDHGLEYIGLVYDTLTEIKEFGGI
ncbi:Protein of unknown function [Bacillus wiedmannii]|uniref:PadR family transcriptional regulator n=1 Tax=Bacillus wiedmannii TaxID=1890302 RepID=A0AB37YRD8_9BACI|nr:Protein of unknown function [Bacillus wiedmannii]